MSQISSKKLSECDCRMDWFFFANIGKSISRWFHILKSNNKMLQHVQLLHCNNLNEWSYINSISEFYDYQV